MSGLPTKKWPGVSALKSDGSDDNGDRGLEFKAASSLHNNVLVSSNESRAPFGTRNK